MITETSATTSRQRGLEQLARVGGGSGEERPFAALDPICPDLGRYTVEFVFGEILSRPGLALSTREIVTVAALAALGTARPQLAYHIGGALNLGWSAAEVVDVILLAAVHAGFPAALNALGVAREVFAGRDDVVMPIPAPAAPAGDPARTGAALLRALDGLAAFDDLAPDLRRYVVEFAYGEVLARPCLELPVKELATVAMLTVLGTAPQQLGVHLRAARNAGCSRDELVEVLLQMAVYAGFPAAINGLAALRDQLSAS